MNDKEWAEFKEKFSNELIHGRQKVSEGGARNGETNFPDRYDPIGNTAKGVLDADGKYHYDTGGPANGAIAGTQAAAGKLTPEEAQAQANEQTVANDQNRVDSLKNQIANVAASIASSMDKAKNATSYAAKETAQKAVESGQSLLDRLKNTLSTIGSNLKSAATTVANKVKAANEESKRKNDETKQKISDAFKKAVDTTKRGLDIGDAIRENKEDEARRENTFREDDYIQSIIRKQADEKYGDTNITDDDNIFEKLSKKIRGSLKDNYIEKQQYDESGLDRLFKSDERRAQDYNDYIQNLIGYKDLTSEDLIGKGLERYADPEQLSKDREKEKRDKDKKEALAALERLALEAKIKRDKQLEEENYDREAWENAASNGEVHGTYEDYLEKQKQNREDREDELKLRNAEYEKYLKDLDMNSFVTKFLNGQNEDTVAKNMTERDDRESVENDVQTALEEYLEELRKKGVLHSELQHHGIKGQRWGERSGPPYPLSRLNKQSYLEKGAALVDKAYGSLSVNQLISQQKAEGHIPSQKGLPNNQNQQKPKGDTRKPDITPEAHRDNKPQQQNNQNNQNNRPNNQQNNQKSNGASVADYISLGSELLTTSNKLIQDDIRKKATVTMKDYAKEESAFMGKAIADWLGKHPGATKVPEDELMRMETRIREEIKKDIKSRSIDGKTAYDYSKVSSTEQNIGNVLGFVATAATTATAIATLIERLKRSRS